MYNFQSPPQNFTTAGLSHPQIQPTVDPIFSYSPPQFVVVDWICRCKTTMENKSHLLGRKCTCKCTSAVDTCFVQGATVDVKSNPHVRNSHVSYLRECPGVPILFTFTQVLHFQNSYQRIHQHLWSSWCPRRAAERLYVRFMFQATNPCSERMTHGHKASNLMCVFGLLP